MYNVYEVKEYDSLDSIAKRFNVPYLELIRINQLEDAYELRSGLKLKIPVDNSTMFQLYKVKKGDTIYGIARKVGVDANTLLMMNGLNNQSYIYPNQDLLVPTEKANVYITQSGESIDSLVRDKNVSIEELLTYNEKIYLIPNQVIVYKNQG